MATTTQLNPLVSEFEAQEQADSYDRWFRAKAQEAIDSKKPRIPHDEVVRRITVRLDQMQARKSA
ncbi:MAG: stability determinant [Burkholderiaceae bacterium]|jgi:hypothetical protein|nr:stability determinant [Burkholderiaceae bacterium]